MKGNLSKEERETSTIWDMRDDMVTVFTVDASVMRKLDARCAEAPDVYACVAQDDRYGGKTYRFPRKLITFRSGKKRVVTDAAR